MYFDDSVLRPMSPHESINQYKPTGPTARRQEKKDRNCVTCEERASWKLELGCPGQEVRING